MWAMLKYLITRIALLRWLLGSTGSVGILIPLVLLLKAIGLPVLLVLLFIGLPALFALLLIGLPIFAVLLLGGVLIGLAYLVFKVGAVVIVPLLVLIIPVVLMTYFLWWLFSGRKRGTGEKPA